MLSHTEEQSDLGTGIEKSIGSIEKDRLADLVNAIANGGLRLVNLVLKDETEIENWAAFLSEANDEPKQP